MEAILSDVFDADTLHSGVARRLRSAGVTAPVELERAVEDVLTQLRSRASVGIAISKAPTVPAGYARALQASENVWREIEEEFGFLTSAEVAVAIGSKSQNRYLASELRRKGKLLGLRRLNAYRYPGFQFLSDGTIHPAIRDLMSAMHDGGWSEGNFIIWLCSPSRAFADGGRPVDHLDDSDVVLAAIAMMAADW